MTRKKADPNAPQKPLSSYNLFCRSAKYQTGELGKLNPKEKVKYWSTKWASLSSEEKDEFVKEAKTLREVYETEFKKYQKTPAYKKWVENQSKQSLSEQIQSNTKFKKSSHQESKKVSDPFGFESDPECQQIDLTSSNPILSEKITIFTPQFLDFNYQRETNLRQLRKLVSQKEEECALLSKHVDKLEQADNKAKTLIEKLDEVLIGEDRLISRLKLNIISIFLEYSEQSSNEVENNFNSVLKSFLSNPEQQVVLALRKFLDSSSSEDFFQKNNTLFT